MAVTKGADAIVVTGDASGDAPAAQTLQEAAKGRPVLIGSGLTPANAASLVSACDGAIVGTSLMSDRSVDPEKAEELMASLA
jgi:predicted TIM-barrel enzyme